MTNDYQPLSDLLPCFWNDLFYSPPPVSYQTGIIPLRQGQVVLIGAPPGWGKTALVMGMTLDALRNHPDLSAVVLNVEMSWEQLLEREVSRQSGVPYSWIISREFRTAPALANQVQAARAAIEQVAPRLTILPPPYSLEAVKGAFDSTGAGLLVLDYIQRISVFHSEPGKNAEDSRQRMNQVMTEVRGFANVGGCAVLAVSAVGRGNGKGKAYSDLSLGSYRESGELEYGADDCYTLEQQKEEVQGYLLKAHKTRYGKRGEVRLTFDGDCQRFSRVDGGTSNG